MPIGSSWGAGTWADTAWAPDTWADAGAPEPPVLDVDGAGGWDTEAPKRDWRFPRRQKALRIMGEVPAAAAPLPQSRQRYQRHARLFARARAWVPPLPQARQRYTESGHEAALVLAIAEASERPEIEALGKELDLLLAVREATRGGEP